MLIKKKCATEMQKNLSVVIKIRSFLLKFLSFLNQLVFCSFALDILTQKKRLSKATVYVKAYSV